MYREIHRRNPPEIRLAMISSGSAKTSSLREGSQSKDLSKIRCNAGCKKRSSVTKEIKLTQVHGKKNRIRLDHAILIMETSIRKVFQIIVLSKSRSYLQVMLQI